MDLRHDVFQALADTPAPNGREIIYHSNPQKMKEVAYSIEPFRNLWKDWFNTLEALKPYLGQA